MNVDDLIQDLDQQYESCRPGGIAVEIEGFVNPITVEISNADLPVIIKELKNKGKVRLEIEIEQEGKSWQTAS